jgi:hypothetical protein
MSIETEGPVVDEPQAPPCKNDAEEAKHVQLRSWCIGRAVALAIELTKAGGQTTLDVMGAAGEMYEFLLTGVGRTHKKTTGKGH